MAQFLELHDEDNVPHLVNIDYIEEVWRAQGNKAVVYFAYDGPNSTEQDHFTAKESYTLIRKRLTK